MQDIEAKMIVEAFQKEDPDNFLILADWLEDNGKPLEAERYRMGNFYNYDYRIAMYHLYKKEIDPLLRVDTSVSKLFECLLKFRSDPVLWKFLPELIHKCWLEMAENYERDFGQEARDRVDKMFGKRDYMEENRAAKIIKDKLQLLEVLGQWRDHRKWKRIVEKHRMTWYMENMLK